MYVIFPADELIYMTYGAVVRVKPRPTLDNLRDPLVSDYPSSRPSSSRTLDQTQPNINTSTSHRNSSPVPSISRHAQKQKSREATPGSIKSLSKPVDREIVNEKLAIADYDRMTDYTGDKYLRESSPSIFLEPPSPDEVSYSGYSRPTSPNSPPTPSTFSKSTTGTKSRPKLKLALGRLVRQQPDLSESNRVREDHKLHVANPTFTRENLRQRNYDAFFESGEPVYHLERKIQNSAEISSTLEAAETNLVESTRTRLNLFNRPKSPAGLRSRSADQYRMTSSLSEVSQKETSKSSGHRSLFGWRGGRGGSLSPQSSMASYNGALKDYGGAAHTESFKNHNSATFKLVKTVSDFTDTLSHLYEEHAAALQTLVATYRKKNGELRKERPVCQSSLYQAWESFLQEIEADSQASSDISLTLSRQVSRQMIEKSFHRKVQSRKIFTHRESFESIISKTEEKLSKCRLDYKNCYKAHRQSQTQISLNQYIDAHNAYVQQLHATNAMLEAFHCETIPQLMQELEDIYADLCSIVADAVLQGAEVISKKANEQAKRYDGLANHCKIISPQQDLINFVRILPQSPSMQKVPKKMFTTPHTIGSEGEDHADYTDNSLPPLRNELILERNSSIQLRPSLDSLKREAAELEAQIRQLHDSVDGLIRTQSRGIENQLYNKANELQEDLSMKKFDLRAKQIHLAAVKAQRELFLSKLDPSSPRDERKQLPSTSTGSMRTKWLRAFKSLKPASTSAPAQSEKRNGAQSQQPLRPNEDGSHNLQEYTYKKITPCDACSQILRGHTRQGLRCRICKLNVHADCAPQLPKCQAKQKLLRRQKSTSELENRGEVEEEKITDIDQIYRVLKQAGEISSKSTTAAAGVGKVKISASGSGPHSSLKLTAQDIPTVNVPECPERSAATRKALPLNKSVNSSTAAGGSYMGRDGQPQQQQSKGLSAPPMVDISCSDYRYSIPSYANLQRKYTITSAASTPPTQLPVASNSTAILSSPADTGLRRRLFAGFRPLSGFVRGRNRSAQHRSISLPETPHSPRRHKLNLRMKSLSLDSPESSELHGQIRRRQPPPGPSSSYYHSGSGGQLEHVTPPSNNSRLHSPSSPSHQRKQLYASKVLKTGSVDLPDDIEKSLSSASTSPCPSPKAHRLLPTNLYLVLYNFKARHGDELDLKAGYKVTVIEHGDPDWWKGKCLGRIGFFPSKYVTRLNAGEKPLQVTHNLQVSDTERGDNMTLLRDQIVIQIGEDVGGMVMVRSADNRQGVCPVKYLQEV